jgi:hypothetical protein
MIENFAISTQGWAMNTRVLKVGIPDDALESIAPEELASFRDAGRRGIANLALRCDDIDKRIECLSRSQSLEDLTRLCLETRLDGMAGYDALLFAIPDQRPMVEQLLRRLADLLTKAATLSTKVAEIVATSDAESYARNVDFRSRLINALAMQRYDEFYLLLRSTAGFSTSTPADSAVELEAISNPVRRGFVHRLASGLYSRIVYLTVEMELEHGPFPQCLDAHRQMAEFAVSQFELAITHDLVPKNYQAWLRDILKCVKDDVIGKLDKLEFSISRADNSVEVARVAGIEPTNRYRLTDHLKPSLDAIRLRLIQLIQQTETFGDIAGQSLDETALSCSVQSCGGIDIMELDRKRLIGIASPPLQVLIYQLVNDQWCASCLDYQIEAWDPDQMESLLKLCDKIEVEESIRNDGIRLQINGEDRQITPDEIALLTGVVDKRKEVFESIEESCGFELSFADPTLASFVNSCSNRGLNVRVTDQRFDIDC